MKLQLALGLGLGLGTHRKVGGAGNKPATFTVTAGDGTNYVSVQVSETTTVTPAGGTSIRIGSSGEFVTTPLTLAANTYQNIYFKDAGSFTIPRRKLVTTLYLRDLGSSVITGDITGMKLTYLYLYYIGSSVITGDITGMKLTYLYLRDLGSSVITGDITGMKLTTLYLRDIGSSVITGDITGMKLTTLYLRDIGSSVITGDITGMKLTTLYLRDLGSSVITGDITGMKLTTLYLRDLGSSVITGDINGMALTRLYLNNVGLSLTYGTNPLNITASDGIQLLGNTAFATAAEYERLIIDAASGTWSPVGSNPFRIDAGTTATDPGWENVKAYVAVLLTKAAWTIIPSAWLEDNGGSWPINWKEYTGE